MSEIHYVRTLGPQGGVDACEGPAIGLDLETILTAGLPPWNIALEVIAGLCEILDIAAEDGQTHGAVDPEHIFVDETGAVSLEGYGVSRDKTSAPERVPRDSRTDLYGLGATILRTISTHPLPAQLSSDDPDRHDDAVIDAVLAVDLSELPEEMQGDIQWFTAKLMSFDREDRPSARDAWRTFVAFASAVDGPETVAWSAAALDGGGARRTPAERPPPPRSAEEEEEEELEGPVVAAGPLAGAMQFERGAGAKAGATAFWSRDQMKQALDKPEEEDEEERPPMGVGGGSATSFWSHEQLDAMQRSDEAAPRPRRTDAKRPPPLPLPPALSPTPPLTPPLSSPPPPLSQSPFVPPPMPPREPMPPPALTPPPVDDGNGMRAVLFGGGLAALAAVTLAGILLAGLLGLVLATRSTEPEPPPEPVPVETPPPEAPRSKLVPVSAPAAPRPRPSKARPTPRPSPEPAVVADAVVRLSTGGEGRVSCAGTLKKFTGSVKLTIEGYKLPASCRVQIGTAAGAFVTQGSGSIRCDKQGNAVVCDKQRVP